MWQAVRNYPDQLIAELRSLPRSPEGYLKARSDSNAKTTPVRLAKLDLDVVARNVLEVSAALRQRPVDILAADFETTIARAS